MKISEVAQKKAHLKFDENPRIGDHMWYISNLDKFTNDYPDWRITYTLDDLIYEMVAKGFDSVK